MLKRLCILSLLTLVVTPSLGQKIGSKEVKRPLRPPLVVGWHDELNEPGLWKPLSMENQPDIYAERPGAVTLRLPHVPENFPYAFQWSGVTRSISADLAHYPVLMARVSSLEPGRLRTPGYRRARLRGPCNAYLALVYADQTGPGSD